MNTELEGCRMMILGVEKKLLWPAFLMGVLAIFLSAPTAQAQSSQRSAAAAAALESKANTHSKAG